MDTYAHADRHTHHTHTHTTHTHTVQPPTSKYQELKIIWHYFLPTSMYSIKRQISTKDSKRKHHSSDTRNKYQHQIQTLPRYKGLGKDFPSKQTQELSWSSYSNIEENRLQTKLIKRNGESYFYTSKEKSFKMMFELTFIPQMQRHQQL